MMSDIDDLIAAGEAALIERNKKELKSFEISLGAVDATNAHAFPPNICQQESENEKNLSNYKGSNAKSSMKEFFHERVPLNHVSSKHKENVENYAVSSESSSLDEPYHEFSSQDDEKSLSNKRNSNENEGNKSLLYSLKNHCAEIFSLSLSMSSSLTNANRLLNHLVKSQSLNSSYEKNLLEEVQLCQQSCLENEASLKRAGEEMHHILAGLSDQQRKCDNQENELKHALDRAFNILAIVTELLNKTGFKHLAPNIKQNGIFIERLLEEIHLGLLLLSGDLPDHILQSRNQQLEAVLSREEKLKTQISRLQEQHFNAMKSKIKELSQLEIKIEKIQKDADDFEYHLKVSEEQKAAMDEAFKKQLSLYEDEITAVRHHMVKVEENAKQRVKEAEENFTMNEDASESLQNEIASFKAQLQLKESQMEAMQDESNGLIKNLKAKISKVETELSAVKAKLVETQGEKSAFAAKVKKLELIIEEHTGEKNSASLEISKLQDQAARERQSYLEDLQELQSKLDFSNTTLCEKNSEVRSRDVKIMQLQTELKLEGQRTLVQKGETDLLEKQVKRLQDRIAKLLEMRPKEDHPFALLEADSLDSKDQKLAHELKKSHEREIHLRSLLEQKDTEMKSLQDSLHSQLLSKNSEMEKLSKSVESLEKEMEDITSSLKVSKGMAHVSEHVADALESRSHALSQLRDSSERLHLDYSRIAKESSSLEEREKRIEELTEELSTSKKATKEAREEARKSRLEAATERQRSAFLQIDLDSARETLRQLRLEQDLWQGLSSWKRRGAATPVSENLSLDFGSQSSVVAAESIKSSRTTLEEDSKT